MDILRGDVFQVYVVDLGADLNVFCHPRRGNEIIYFSGWISRQFIGIAAFFGKFAASFAPPFRVDFLDMLHHFKKPRSAGDAVCLQGGGHGKADGFLRPAGVSHHQIGGQRIKPALHAFHGGVEGFQINGDICPSALLHSAPPHS